MTDKMQEVLIEQLKIIADNTASKFFFGTDKYGFDHDFLSGQTVTEAITTIEKQAHRIEELEKSDWVPIDEIPKEWRNGRKLFLLSVSLGYSCMGWYSMQSWRGEVGKNPTHAMLPPTPPKEP